jgi:hypothetical protein
MASGHVNRTNRPNTWLHRPTCDVKKVLANSEPSTHRGRADSEWSLVQLPLLDPKRTWGSIFYPDAEHRSRPTMC